MLSDSRGTKQNIFSRDSLTTTPSPEGGPARIQIWGMLFLSADSLETWGLSDKRRASPFAATGVSQSTFSGSDMLAKTPAAFQDSRQERP